jgi:diguanylate cyclase (GGDEF)-like protein
METGLLKVLGEVFLSVWIRRQSIQMLQETQQQLNQRIQELENRAREINLLTEMSNRLQIASRFEETFIIVSDYVGQLFPGSAGALWMMEPPGNSFVLKNQWGPAPENLPGLITEDCWALRRGRQYFVASEQAPGLYCRHLAVEQISSSLCMPILAQGKTVGLLHLETGQEMAPFNLAAQQLLAVTAEQMGLALSNLQLRDNLREQAIRDPLTGLYNRHYMEISLERELNRAARNHQNVSLMLLDIDHFRQINNNFDHATGDQLLAELGKILRSSVRSEDIACRFGGEKFMLILPDTSLEVAQQRAIHLRDEVKQISIWHDGRLLPEITLTIVLANWPQHALDMFELIRLAESTLKQSKLIGPDQVRLPD